MTKIFCKCATLLVLLLPCYEVIFAHHLGVQGSIYSISEPDMLTAIHQKLENMQQTGELERQNQAVLQRTIQHILRPAPVRGVNDLPEGQTPTVREFDPSMMITQDIPNEKGDILIRQGTRVNPLDYIHFDEVLVFINADNDRQIKWASQLIKRNHFNDKKHKIILVNGDINAAATALKSAVYFDQYGKLCERFNITHTPTLVYEPQKQTTDIKKLVVKEVSID